MPKVRMKHRGGCAIGGSGIEWQASNITHPGIKNEDLPLAQIQIVADSSSLSLYVCFYFVDDFIAKFSRTIIGGCGECSAGTGQRAQVALDRTFPRRTRGGGGGRAGRFDDILFWRGQWRDLEDDRCRELSGLLIFDSQAGRFDWRAGCGSFRLLGLFTPGPGESDIRRGSFFWQWRL